MATTSRKKVDVCDELLDLLSAVDRPGKVLAGGDRPLTTPGLEVEGLGTVALPLGKAQAGKLIKRCHQAPYGKGTETRVDTDVRRVWLLDPQQFQLTNPKWDELVASILDDVQQDLGLEDRKLTAHLYNLLVYEKGGFFLPHRDGEKLDRMVATLVIGLPSVHKGGELIVLHDGREHQMLFAGAASGHELSYAAFYADCQHEIRPLRSGYRLCLTYNVTLARSRGKKGIAAPSYGPTAAAIAKLLGDWHSDADRPKIAVTLDHRYTQDGLALDKLKGIDQARAEVLFEAAEQADCIAHLALVTLWQSGSAEGGYDADWDGRVRGSSWSDDEDEDDDDYGGGAGEYDMGEVYEQSLSVNHWSDRQGKRVRLGEIDLEEAEIISATPLFECDPSEEEFEGYTGNAGMTLERWYHRAAVVIWPREKHFEVLCGAGTDAAIGGLEPMVRRLKRTAKARRDEQRRACLSFAAAIIDSWKQGYRAYPGEDTDAVDRSVFPALLCELDDVDIVRRFLKQVMPGDSQIQIDNSFTKFCSRHGWESFGAELIGVMESVEAPAIVRNAELLKTLCLGRDKNTDRIKLCTRLSKAAVQALVAFDRKYPNDDWRIRDVDRSVLLRSLVTAMLAIDARKPLSELVDHTLASKKYDLTDAHLTAIFRLESRLAKLPAANPAISQWLDACCRDLEKRTAEPPKKPADCRRNSKLSCRCSDCRELAAFLEDPDQRQARFPLAQDRRRHLHEMIDGDRCDVTHVTERRGRPYTLVCTKTTATYDAARETHERDLKNHSRLTALQKKLPQTPTPRNPSLSA